MFQIVVTNVVLNRLENSMFYSRDCLTHYTEDCSITQESIERVKEETHTQSDCESLEVVQSVSMYMLLDITTFEYCLSSFILVHIVFIEWCLKQL